MRVRKLSALLTLVCALAVAGCSAVAQNPDDTTVIDIDVNEIDAGSMLIDNEALVLEDRLEEAADRLEAAAQDAEDHNRPLSRWRYISSDRHALMFIDSETVRKVSVLPFRDTVHSGRDFWIMNFARDARTKVVSQRREHWRAHCTERTMAVSDVVTHSRAGQLVARSKASGEFRPVIPESVGEDLLKWVCEGPAFADWGVLLGDEPWKVADRHFALVDAKVEGVTAIALALHAGSSAEAARIAIDALPVAQRSAARRAVGLD